MKSFPTILASLLFACGGNSTVDLGGKSANAGWSNTFGSAAPATSGAPAVPETLYQGDFVRAMAVDETTIAATIQNYQGTRIEMCQLSDCKGTLQTIYSVAADVCAPFSSPSNFGYLIVSHGEVIWPTCNGTDVSSGLYYGFLVACATSGCPSGPRRIANVSQVLALTASADSVYWLLRNPNYTVARCPRQGCETPTLSPLSDEDLDLIGVGDWQMVPDESAGVIYTSGGGGIARMRLDFSSGLTSLYKGGVPGLAVVGAYIYFGLSLLTGQIRRCSVSGCDSPEVVTAAPGWPRDLMGDERAVYWSHHVSQQFSEFADHSPGAIAALPLDGTSTPIEVANFSVGSIDSPSSAVPRPVMNSHHLYWFDSIHTSDWPKSAIRMVAR